MNKGEFVGAIKISVFESSLVGTLEVIKDPPGRQPHENLVKLSNWFKSLDTKERELVELLIKQSVNNAVFGMLCVLDGVRAIEDSPDKGELILIYEKGNEKTRLNSETGMSLHDLYNSQ